MPRINEQLEPLDAEAYPSRRGWQRSSRGNLWKPYNGKRLTVFRRGDGYSWCIAEGEQLRFSPQTYPSEEVACDAVWVEMEELEEIEAAMREMERGGKIA